VAAGAVAVEAARGLADDLLARGAANVAQNKLIGGKRDGFAGGGGREAFGERSGGGLGSLFGCGFGNGLAELVHPIVFGDASTGSAVEEFVFFEQFREER